MENNWNGSLLDTTETVLHFAQDMTWKGQPPVVVKLIEKPYPSGVKLSPQEMEILELRFERLPGLEKWFVRITPLPP